MICGWGVPSSSAFGRELAYVASRPLISTSAHWRAFCLWSAYVLYMYIMVCTWWRYLSARVREVRTACILLFSFGPGAGCGDLLSFHTQYYFAVS